METFTPQQKMPERGQKVFVLDNHGYWTCATYSKDYPDVFDFYIASVDLNIHGTIRLKDVVKWCEIPE